MVEIKKQCQRCGRMSEIFGKLRDGDQEVCKECYIEVITQKQNRCLQ